MVSNRLKAIWAQGETAVNGWLHIPSSWTAELMAHQGFDSLLVDLQHGLSDVDTALTMFQAINTTNTVPLARVPWNDPGLIGRLLDMGALGIVCPMVNTRAECEQFVGACRYYPDGYRSLGPTRPSLAYGADYARHANTEVATFAMIETKTAVDNAAEIISTPGLDAIYVGPGDLSLTLGSAQRVDSSDPIYIDALDRLLGLCKQHGVVAGIHTASPHYAQQMARRGFQFVTLWTDTAMLSAKARETVTVFREGDAMQVDTKSAY